MQIELSAKEFRHLLDMVYIGNWILNSTRGDDRFTDYDNLESKLFGLCKGTGMQILAEDWNQTVIPSKAYTEGGIHEAIAYYEDNILYQILAEELSHRDMGYADITEDNHEEIVSRMNQYLSEFELSGLDHLILEDN